MKAPADKLSTKQQRFCELIAAGHSGQDAYLNAGYKVKASTARTNASRALTNANIKAYIAELRAPEKNRARMTKDEKLRWLEGLIRTPVEELTPGSPYAQELVEEVIGGGSRGRLRRGEAPSGNETTGPTVIRRKLKMGDKLRAIDLHSKLLGHFEPDRVEVDVGEKTLLSIKERAAQVASTLARTHR